jgi:hypothetical protein
LDSETILRASDSFHSHSIYDFVQIGAPPDEFYGRLLLVFEYQDPDKFIHSLAWIRHFKKVKKSKLYEKWIFQEEETAQVIRVTWITKKLSLVVDVNNDGSFYSLE